MSSKWTHVALPSTVLGTHKNLPRRYYNLVGWTPPTTHSTSPCIHYPGRRAHAQAILDVSRTWLFLIGYKEAQSRPCLMTFPWLDHYVSQWRHIALASVVISLIYLMTATTWQVGHLPWQQPMAYLLVSSTQFGRAHAKVLLMTRLFLIEYEDAHSHRKDTEKTPTKPRKCCMQNNQLMCKRPVKLKL